MKTNVRQWGNSLGIRIPQHLAKEANLIEGTELDINIINQKIVLSKPNLTLENLLTKITTTNLHNEVDTGSINGKEVW